MNERFTIVAKVGVVATVAYASSYYLPAILARDIAQDLGTSSPTIFLAFSLSLLLTAVLGPWVGRLVDKHGGRSVLLASCFTFVLGLVALALASNVLTMFLAWMVLGFAMTAGAIDVGYSTVVHIHGAHARPLITGITLVAGFASTVGWLATEWLNHRFGWRGTCLVWAAVHIVVAMPMILALPPARTSAGTPPAPLIEATTKGGNPPSRATAWLLAYVFGATWFVGTAMAAHLPNLLHEAGATVATGILISSLLGPAQVLGRFLEFRFLKDLSPLVSARIASMGHGLGAVLLIVAGAPASIAFAVLHGIGNGVMTVANGTLPLHLFGSAGYGARQGVLMVLARFCQAISPFLFGLAISRFGISALWISIALGASSFIALQMLSMKRHEAHAEGARNL